MTYPNQTQYKGAWLKNKKHGAGVELNLKVNTQRVGEWRRGKWVRWISATQKIHPVSGLQVGVLGGSNRVGGCESSMTKQPVGHNAQGDYSSFNCMDSLLRDYAGHDSRGHGLPH